MASGLPAVCADATGSRSLVDPQVTGYLAAVGDEDAMFEAVRRLAIDADLRRRMGQAARARSLLYSWTRRCPDFSPATKPWPGDEDRRRFRILFRDRRRGRQLRASEAGTRPTLGS